MTSYSTLGGYAVILGVGVLYYISKRTTSKGPRVKQSAKQIKTAEKEKPNPSKAKKLRKGGSSSSGDQENGANEKVPKKKKQVTIDDSSNSVPQLDSDHEEEVDNKEFARQFSSAKSGTNLQPSKTTQGSRQKSIKQSKAQEKVPVFETSSDVTAPSSAAGGDADDDQSSQNSPELGATHVHSPITNGGISDMLEAPAPGPSILKITSPTNPTPAKKAKASAVPEQAETKKQRQNKKKAEAKKEARAEEEKERKIALEKQRRTAREAEGRAAKDGSSFVASQPPKGSAWTAPTSVTPVNGNDRPSKENIALLDTYEPPSSKVVPSPNSESDQTSSDWQKIAGSVSEEDQIRILQNESNWETVKEKRSKKKSKAVNSPSPKKTETIENKGAEHKADRTEEYTGPDLINPTGPGQKWSMVLEAKNKSNGEVHTYEREEQDSEWDVNGYDKN